MRVRDKVRICAIAEPKRAARQQRVDHAYTRLPRTNEQIT